MKFSSAKSPESFIFVIFGGSGDLTKRKLVPALFRLYQQKLLPEKFAILGLGRKEFNDKSYRKSLSESVVKFSDVDSESKAQINDFVTHLHYQKFDMSRQSEYKTLSSRIETIDTEYNIGGKYLYYLATPPEFFGSIAENLQLQGLQDDKDAWKRIILEKPIGHDLKSARELNHKMQRIFDEEQIYRIDHYLGKETVQNILAFRFANGIFEPLWNRRYIHHVEITAAEQVGVEDRGGYYENSGALRDMVQNHLLQVAATVAMEPPALFEPKAVRDEKAKVFNSLRPIPAQDIAKHVIRGQYIASGIEKNKITGYRNEPNVNPKSQTETFVALKFFIDNWRWGGVPFYIRTGKRLPTRVTEVVIHYNQTPHHMFKNGASDNAPQNQLILRIQPDEGILLKIGMKVPGAGFDIKNVGMDFHYSDLTDVKLPEAYERLLLDALMGDSTLYARADGVEEAWKFVDPILDAWQNDPSIKLYGYPAGSWGPKETRQLFDEPKEDWRYPCKNLTGDETYCEL